MNFAVGWLVGLAPGLNGGLPSAADAVPKQAFDTDRDAWSHASQHVVLDEPPNAIFGCGYAINGSCGCVPSNKSANQRPGACLKQTSSLGCGDALTVPASKPAVNGALDAAVDTRLPSSGCGEARTDHGCAELLRAACEVDKGWIDLSGPISLLHNLLARSEDIHDIICPDVPSIEWHENTTEALRWVKQAVPLQIDKLVVYTDGSAQHTWNNDTAAWSVVVLAESAGCLHWCGCLNGKPAVPDCAQQAKRAQRMTPQLCVR